MNNKPIIVDFSEEHWQQAYQLWRRIPGIGLSKSDEEREIARFLDRNRGFSLVAIAADEVVGSVMAGHDGRRGYLYHVCVDPSFQGQGIARAMINESLSRLKSAGILKVSLYCKADNESGQAFWTHAAWQRRTDLALFAKDL